MAAVEKGKEGSSSKGLGWEARALLTRTERAQHGRTVTEKGEPA